MRHALHVALALAMLACTNKQGAPKVPAGPTAPASPPPPKEPEVAGDGFFMDVPKWQPERAKGLTARYKWGSADERTTTATDGGGYWRLTFPERPKPSDIVRLQLRYELELTKENRDEISKTIDKVIAEAISVVSAAAKKTGGTLPDRVAAESSSIVTAAKPLAAYVTGDGTPGDELILERLGFERRPNGGLALSDPRALVALAKLETSANVADAKEDVKTAAGRLAPTPAQATDCSTALQAAQKDDARAKDARVACANELLNVVVEQRKAAEAAVAAVKPPATASATLTNAVTAAKSLEAHAKSLAATAGVDGPEPLTLKTDRIALESDPAIERSHAWRAYTYARLLMLVAEAEEAHGAPRTKLTADLKSRIDVLEQDHLGSVILAAGGEKRVYDVSTGVVYVGGLQDVVVPIMIAACPFGGCLRRGETFLDNGWRTLSADLGIRAQTLDKPDPRGRDALAFLLGLSVNPIYFLRISAGFYTFENTQSDKWNVTGYVGTTVNILQAAELFGVVGFGTPAAPKIVGQ